MGSPKKERISKESFFSTISTPPSASDALVAWQPSPPNSNRKILPKIEEKRESKKGSSRSSTTTSSSKGKYSDNPYIGNSRDYKSHSNPVRQRSKIVNPVLGKANIRAHKWAGLLKGKMVNGGDVKINLFIQ